MESQIHKLHVKGMHCKACVFLIEDAVGEVDWVNNVKVSLKHQTVELVSENDLTPEQIAELLNPLLVSQWYSIHNEIPQRKVNWGEYILAFIISWVLIYGFIQIQQLWFLQMLNAENRTYGTSFVIWLIASVSSCLAVVWWVVLALWTIYSENKSFRPHMLFHIWRLIWFFILWWLLWLIGSAFQLSQTVSTVLNMIIAVVLFILWLNLLWVVRWGVTLGWGLFKRFQTGTSMVLWPILVWVWTFFLPCGFTQSMQIYSLSTGTFLSGWLTMLSFALGTLPILLLLSITWKSIQKSESANLFFKTIGIILIVLAFYNFLNSLVVLGVISPLFIL